MNECKLFYRFTLLKYLRFYFVLILNGKKSKRYIKKKKNNKSLGKHRLIVLTEKTNQLKNKTYLSN